MPHPTRIYHNPRCSKSRAALELLRARGVQPHVVDYLDNPPDVLELTRLVESLGLPVRALLRHGEAEYAELGLADPALSDAELIAAVARHPRLMERPVFVHGDRAVIGRPPERVLELLDDAPAPPRG